MTKMPTKLVDAGAWLKGLNDGWMYANLARKIISEAPTAEIYGQWISMEERPPAVSDEYIVMIEGAEKSTCLYYDAEEGVWFDEREEENTYRVVKWMPLPPESDAVSMGEFSDGYHSFNELYHHRAVLFAMICNQNASRAWKSKLHDTGDMFDGMFIVGIETPEGQATYHYDVEPYWDMFRVRELERAPKWDGHSPAEAIDRIAAMAKYPPLAKIADVVLCEECTLHGHCLVEDTFNTVRMPDCKMFCSVGKRRKQL